VLISCGAILAIDLKGRSVVISFFKEERSTMIGGKGKLSLVRDVTTIGWRLTWRFMTSMKGIYG